MLPPPPLMLLQVARAMSGWCCWQVASGAWGVLSCASKASTSHTVSDKQAHGLQAHGLVKPHIIMSLQLEEAGWSFDSAI
jgi:hypothetical protein